jgi:hypothetical protein
VAALCRLLPGGARHPTSAQEFQGDLHRWSATGGCRPTGTPKGYSKGRWLQLHISPFTCSCATASSSGMGDSPPPLGHGKSFCYVSDFRFTPAMQRKSLRSCASLAEPTISLMTFARAWDYPCRRRHQNLRGQRKLTLVALGRHGWGPLVERLSTIPLTLQLTSTNAKLNPLPTSCPAILHAKRQNA